MNITVRTVDRKDEWFKRIAPVMNTVDGSIDGYDIEFFESGDAGNLNTEKIFISANAVGIRMVGEGGYHPNQLRKAMEGKSQEWLAANTEVKSIEIFSRGPRESANDLVILGQKQLANGTWMHDQFVDLVSTSAYDMIARIQGGAPDGWWVSPSGSDISLTNLGLINPSGVSHDVGDGTFFYSNTLLPGEFKFKSMRNQVEWHGGTAYDYTVAGFEDLRKVVFNFHNIPGNENTGKFSLGRLDYGGTDRQYVCGAGYDVQTPADPFFDKMTTIYINSESETTIVYQNKEYGWNSSKLHPSTDGRIVICDTNGQDHNFRIDMQSEEATMELVKLIRAGQGEDIWNIRGSI